MAEYKGTLQTADGDILLPKTTAEQVRMADGKPLSDFSGTWEAFEPEIVDLIGTIGGSPAISNLQYTKRKGLMHTGLSVIDLWIELEFSISLVPDPNFSQRIGIVVGGLPDLSMLSMGLAGIPVWDVFAWTSNLAFNPSQARIRRVTDPVKTAIWIVNAEGGQYSWPDKVEDGLLAMHTSILI